MVDNRGIKKKLLSGTKWTTLSIIFDAIIQIVKLAIVSRFITKTDFGIVAIINMVLGMTTIFADLGFSVGVLSIKNISPKEFSSVFWIQALLFTLLYIILSFSSPLIAEFYNASAIEVLIPLALLNLFCWSIGKLYDTLIHKNMLFKTMAIRNIFASLFSLFGIIIFCFVGLGIYSLILATLLYSFIVNVWNFIAGQSQMPLKFHCSVKEIRPFFKIGVYKMATQICDYFSDKIDIIILGKFLGMDTLGVYNVAKDLLQRVTGIFKAVISKVTLPALAKVNDDDNSLKRYFCILTMFSSFITTPICVLVMVFAKDILIILYGITYVEAVPLVQLFGGIYILSSIVAYEGVLVSATGKTHLDFYWTIVRIFFIIPITWISARISVEAVIVGQYIIGLLGFFYVWRYIIYPIISIELRDYINLFGVDLLTGIVVFALLNVGIYNNVLDISNIILRLFVYGLFFVGVYILLLFLFNKRKIAYLKSYLFP